MNNSKKLACAIAAILSGPAGAAVAATDPSASSGLQAIVVTAQRREESVQNVPITIQAITGAQLGQLSITTFDDVLKYLPNVTFGSNGPGQGNIFMRGLSAGFAGNQSSATFASFPNVATYLDDQSLQFPARNLDVYMVDMERVEVLEGPQGHAVRRRRRGRRDPLHHEQAEARQDRRQRRGELRRDRPRRSQHQPECDASICR